VAIEQTGQSVVSQLAGRVVVVTAATRGFGRTVAERLADEGCHLALCARDPVRLKAFAERITSTWGVTVFSEALDVTTATLLEDFVDSAADHLGGIDGLVANAGDGFGNGLLGSTAEDWSATYEINVGHTVRALRSCVPHMKRRGGGAVVIVSSISGWKPARRAQYGAAKAAQIYLAASFARELASDRIRVNTISPGAMLNPDGFWEGYRELDPNGYEEFLQQMPNGAPLDGTDVADVVAYLLSDQSRAINGANIPVDGAQNAPSLGGY
jgi:3-oxoacyl-[acyl-carrier protein] reductase